MKRNRNDNYKQLEWSILKFHIFTISEEIVSFQAQKELILKSKTESENIKQHNQKLQVCFFWEGN